MTISENLLLFIGGVGILQAFILACVIYFHPKSDRSVTSFLAIYIGSFGITGLFPIVPHYFAWQNMVLLDPYILITGPALYLYVISFKEQVTWRKALPHFALFAIYFVADCFLYYMYSNRYPPSNHIPEEILQNPFVIAKATVRMSQMVAYYFLAGRALTIYQKSIQQLFSETSRINLQWVRWLLGGYIILVVALIAMFFFMVQFPENFKLLVLLNLTFPTPYLYIATFKGISQPSLWQIQAGVDHQKVEEEMHQAEEVADLIQENGKDKGVKAILSKDKVEEITLRAISLMENDRLYSEAELTLQQLADKIQTPAYLVSHAINEGVKKNFYDFVNGYRVEEAKRLLMDPKNQNYKIISVGFEAGFNSKTTFNTVFKKFTGLTPTDFKDRQRALVPEAASMN